MTLSKEFNWFLENQGDLVANYNGQILAIKELKVIGVYNSYGEAYIVSAQDHRPGSFLLQKCSEGSKDYSPNFK